MSIQGADYRLPIRVLLADDDHLVRTGLAAIFESTKDITVVAQASDGRAAIEAFATRSIDVVLLDIQMPRVDGIQALREVTRQRSQVPVAMLTTFSDDHLIADALGAGALGFLLKSDEPQQLILGVRALAAGGGAFSPRVARWLADREQIGLHVEKELLQLKKTLTDRQLELLAHIGRGLSNSQIAALMHLSEGTVKQYVSQLLNTLEVANRVHAAIIAYKSGLLC